MADVIYGDNVEGDKVGGNKIITINQINSINLDISALKNILETQPSIIQQTLKKLNTLTPYPFNPDERTIPILTKNLINGLTDFYENFIKSTEQKLAALDKFFQENDSMEDIEGAADSIKIFIFSYMNRNSNILDAHILNLIIQEHIREISDATQKQIMKLTIYYLYRFCYIGSKNA